ncbi:MAG: pyridoxamine 5'-phosphate oxidase [Bacteroidetes bacterium]|nr:pyridoxamine 5'-phosphate oxidase [Bacteroidota bacterium]
MEKTSLADLRTEFKKGSLDEHDVKKDPFEQFDVWFKQAVAAQLPEANAMAVATASKEGRPSVRMVLLKNYDEKGFVFFTNYESAKGKNISENPMASLLFFWESLERQIRITGSVEKISPLESLEYFRTRPVDSQLGAWASHQSSILTARSALEAAFKKMLEDFKNKQIPLPPHWGGLRIVPDEFEFWQGRESRLHDRIAYKKDHANNWKIVRLSP